YFKQLVGPEGQQAEAYPAMDFELQPITLQRTADGSRLMVEFPFRDRVAHAQVWRADVRRAPLFLLDTDIPEDGAGARRITDRLYGGDSEHRRQQEIVLGIGGMRALQALGEEPTVVHLNEGHAAFAAVERARRTMAEPGAFGTATSRLAERVVFTTHTPVP